MSCNHNHRHNEKFSKLPDSQGSEGRHKCAGCAYEQGFQQGVQKIESPKLDYAILPDSQASVVRHKCVDEAFAMGYSDGIKQKT